MSVPNLFDALIAQTRTRGGCPSVGDISHAALTCDNIIACWTEVREQAVQAGMSVALARAVEAMDSAVELYEGTEE